MRYRNLVHISAAIGAFIAMTGICSGAYNHMGEIDSAAFLAVYPDKKGTKLDSCNLCHTGGQKGSTTMGSCQWCHDKYGYDAHGNIQDTLNAYGKAYFENGRSKAAVEAIKNMDSDGDGYSNQVEIAATRYPGDAKDDPSKVTAPSRVYSREELETMPRHEQFLLMCASKSIDDYATYGGVPMSDLLRIAGFLSSATDITVYAPDGFSQFHPLSPDPNPAYYHVNGSYPQATYYYNKQADVAKNQVGWANYSSPDSTARNHGDVIYNEGGLKMLLAFERDGQYLTSGVLNKSNKLDGEGPFRVVPPQKVPGPPDQSSTYTGSPVIWPYNKNGDHNAGYSSRSTTIIKVGPLPAGTTDIDTLEAGWNYIDDKKLIVYGAIDPLPTIQDRMRYLLHTLWSLNQNVFRISLYKQMFILDTRLIQKMINKGQLTEALNNVERLLMKRVDGCKAGGDADPNDWISDCNAQNQVYWSLYELSVLLKIPR